MAIITSNKLHIGKTIIDKLYIGNSQVNEVYIGETLLYAFSSVVKIYKDTDVSKLKTNEEATEVYIELTSNNYTSRIDEVLEYYPNCTDIYLFDDGSVTSLLNMLNGNNETHKIQIKKVVFLDGYFDNLTDMMYTFYGCTSLTTVSAIPQGVTDMYGTFYGCTALTTPPDIPNSVTDMEYTFRGCTSLTTAPAIPQGVTSMRYTFYGCTKLTTAPTIPNGVTSMSYTFAGCTSLTTATTIPSSVTNMSGTFRECTSLTVGPEISSTKITNIMVLYYGCTKLQSCYVPIYATTYSNTLYNVPSTCNITWLGERTTNLNVTSTLNYNNPNRTDIRELVTEHLADLLLNKLTIVNKKGTLNDTYSATTDYTVGNFIIGSFYYDSTSEFMPGTCRMYKAILNGVEIIPILDTNGFPSFLNTQNGSIYYNQYSGGNLVAGNIIGTYGNYSKLDYIMAVSAVVRASNITVSNTSHNLEYYIKSADAHDTNSHIVNQMVFSSSNANTSTFNHYIAAWYGNNFVDSSGNRGQTKSASTAGRTLTLGSTCLAYLTTAQKTQATTKGWTLQ